MLCFYSQDGYTNEQATVSGTLTTIHNVVKNSPFHITYTINDQMFQNDSSFSVSCSLYYETTPYKPVDYLFSKPLDFKVLTNTQPHFITIEAKIKVLTSHREDILFRVFTQLIDSQTSSPIQGFSCFSEPIRVVSKTEQAKKNKGNEKQLTIINSTPAVKNTPCLISILPQNTSAKTTTSGTSLTISQEPKLENSFFDPMTSNSTLIETNQHHQAILEQLKRIEEEAQWQCVELGKISSNDMSSTLSFSTFGALSPKDSDEETAFSTPDYKRQKESGEIATQFGNTLARICSEFRRMPLEQRDDAITHLMDVLSPSEMDRLDDFISNLESCILFLFLFLFFYFSNNCSFSWTQKFNSWTIVFSGQRFSLLVIL